MEVKVCDNYCRDCFYYQGNDDASRCCNYYLFTDKRRKCDAGAGCEKKLKRKRRRKLKDNET